jgi:hypothetical protein
MIRQTCWLMVDEVPTLDAAKDTCERSTRSSTYSVGEENARRGANTVGGLHSETRQSCGVATNGNLKEHQHTLIWRAACGQLNCELISHTASAASGTEKSPTCMKSNSRSSWCNKQRK